MYTSSVENMISSITKIMIGDNELWTSIATAIVSINICDSMQGIAPFENSLIMPNVNVFPNIIK